MALNILQRKKKEQKALEYFKTTAPKIYNAAICQLPSLTALELRLYLMKIHLLIETTESFREGYFEYLRLASSQLPLLKDPVIKLDLLEIRYITYIKAQERRTKKSGEDSVVLVKGTSNLGLVDYNGGVGTPVQNANMNPVLELLGRKVLQVACGDLHTIALVSQCQIDFRTKEWAEQKDKNSFFKASLCTNCTEIIGWGDNSCGQIIDAESHVFSGPMVISGMIPNGLDGPGFVSVSAFEYGSAAMDAEGNIWTWGRHNIPTISQPPRAMGIDPKAAHKGKPIDQKPIGEHSVRRVSGKSIPSPKRIVLHSSYLVALSDSGLHLTGKLCDSLSYPELTQISNDSGIKSFACGKSHVLIVDKNSSAKGIGSNAFGQLAMRDSKTFSQIKECEFFRGEEIERVLATGDLSIIVTENKDTVLVGKLGEKHFPKPNYINLETHEKRKAIAASTEDLLGQAGCESNESFVFVSGVVNNTTLYCMSNKSKVFVWNTKTSPSFIIDESFPKKTGTRNIATRKNFFMFWESPFSHEEVALSSPNECTLNEVSVVEVAIQFSDEFGPLNCVPAFIKTQFCVFSNKTRDISDKFAADSIKNIEAKPLGDPVSIPGFSVSWSDPDILVKDLHFDENTGCLKMSVGLFFQEKEKYLFVGYGQKVIRKGAIKVKRGEAPFKDPRIDEAKEEEMRKEALKKEKAEKAKEERLQKEQEEAEKGRAAKEKTEQRAQEALRKHRAEEESKKQADEAQRRALLEIKTGGGYDLDKLAELKEKMTGNSEMNQMGKTNYKGGSHLTQEESKKSSGPPLPKNKRAEAPPSKSVIQPQPSSKAGPQSSSNKPQPPATTKQGSSGSSNLSKQVVKTGQDVPSGKSSASGSSKGRSSPSSGGLPVSSSGVKIQMSEPKREKSKEGIRAAPPAKGPTSSKPSDPKGPRASSRGKPGGLKK